MKTKNQSDELTGLDVVDPETHPARDAKHFRPIIAARKKVEGAEAELRKAVRTSPAR